jgi:Protein of unknown function (DUF1320)
MRFIQPADYQGYIKPEILKQLTGVTDLNTTSIAQMRAEDTAISTITEYLGGTYNCAAIFTAKTGDDETRNLHIVKLVIVLALYYLYHQSGMKDLPEHRKVDYDDAISWLKDAGRRNIRTTLPLLPDNSFAPDIFISSRKPFRHKW